MSENHGHDYHGHVTLEDGSHVMLTESEAEELWENSEREDKALAAEYPTAEACVFAISRAKERLRRMGWEEPQYVKGSGPLLVIEAGCSRVLQGQRMMDSFWVEDGGDLWPSTPLLVKHQERG